MNESDQIADMSSLKASFCFIEKEIDRINIRLNALAEEHKKYDEAFWELHANAKNNREEIKLIEEKLRKSTVAYFLKHNWWKVGGTLISIATILGAIGEYLYRLPPPK